MFAPPDDVTDAQVLALVRDAWAVDAAGATYVALGFGAHHWRVGDLFVTLDDVDGRRHDAASLEATYAGAAALAADLEFVHAPLRSPTHGTFTVPCGDRRLSVTPWTDAPRATEPADRIVLDRLHAHPVPDGLRRWAPLIGPDLAEDLARRTVEAWLDGPHGETARRALLDHLAEVAGWVAAYHRQARLLDPADFVATHGEPHERNLLAAPSGPLLVDWESLLVAPRERDLHQAGLPGDAATLAMFDLEWRLDEIAQYAAWFAGPHGDSANDHTALGGLRHELTREPRHSAAVRDPA